jgi:predicted small lipoprotein YifL
MRPIPLATLFILTLALPACGEPGDVYLPDYDRLCDSLDAQPLDVDSVLAMQDAWQAPIPRSIHQIWLGPVDKLHGDYAEKVAAWQAYAAQLGYTYRLWREADLAELRADMAPGNAELFDEFSAMHAYQAAADILRYEIVHKHGGVYADCDIRPPTHAGAFVDFARFVPMHGLVLAPEPGAPNIGTGDGLFAMNGWFMAGAQHPLMDHLRHSVATNVVKWTQTQQEFIAAYATGPFLLNHTLAGAFTLLPISFLKKLNMIDFW